jgi:hypothetical protein
MRTTLVAAFLIASPALGMAQRPGLVQKPNVIRQAPLPSNRSGTVTAFVTPQNVATYNRLGAQAKSISMQLADHQKNGARPGQSAAFLRAQVTVYNREVKNFAAQSYAAPRK